MKKRILTKEQDIYLRSIALGKSVKECTAMLNEKFGSTFTVGQVRSYKNNHSIISGKKPWEFVNHNKMRILTTEQDQWLRDNAKGKSDVEITKMLNKEFGTFLSTKQIDSYKGNHGINSGLTGRFTKGHTPANKGKKFPGQTNRTTFKKGNMPKNTDPVGTEKLLADGYIWVKVDNQPKASKKINWRPKQVKIWQDKHGPIPKGHIVIFLDGDRTNFDLDNLRMISQSTNARLNQNHLRHSDKEITEAGVAVAELITTISSAKRRIRGK